MAAPAPVLPECSGPWGRLAPSAATQSLCGLGCKRGWWGLRAAMGLQGGVVAMVVAVMAMSRWFGGGRSGGFVVA